MVAGNVNEKRKADRLTTRIYLGHFTIARPGSEQYFDVISFSYTVHVLLYLSWCITDPQSSLYQINNMILMHRP